MAIELFTNEGSFHLDNQNRDAQGMAWTPCATGACDHEDAPAGARVWHDEAHAETAWEAEEPQIVMPEFAAWLATTSFSGIVEAGDRWDTAEAWPSADTMAAARTCYIEFIHGDKNAAQDAMEAPQQPFV